MNEQDNESGLALDEVVRRFADSEQALSQATEKLEALARAEQTQATAARGLSEASSATTELVKVAQGLIGRAEETQRLARQVLQAGANLIDGTDLKEIQAGVSQTQNAVLEGFERLGKAMGEVRERDQRIAELTSELDRISGALTSRQRKKLGLQ